MPRDLPPLNALRAFDAAARHLNFTRAADELFVTQGAISRQVRQLEDNLGVSLFVRDGPKVRLTDAGERYRDVVNEGLAVIRRGTIDLRRQTATPTLTVSILPSFATLWLVPRIAEFQAEHPGLELRIASSYDLVDFDRSPDIDVAIRLGKGHWPNVYAERLFYSDVFPVCAPGLLRNSNPFRKPEDILDYPLIYATDAFDEWDRWFEAAGVDDPPPHSGPRYSDQLSLQQAAIEGQGITLARSLLVEPELRAGRLIKPIDFSVRSTFSYYFVCAPGRQDAPQIRLFLDWLRHEATRTDSSCARLCDGPEVAGEA